MNLGSSAESPSASLRRAMALCRPWSKSTKVSPGQIRECRSSRVTRSPEPRSRTSRTCNGWPCSRSFAPFLRSSPARTSSSKTSKQSTRAGESSVEGMPLTVGTWRSLAQLLMSEKAEASQESAAISAASQWRKLWGAFELARIDVFLSQGQSRTRFARSSNGGPRNFPDAAHLPGSTLEPKGYRNYETCDGFVNQQPDVRRRLGNGKGPEHGSSCSPR